MEPGAVKIDDWKQIRNRIRKMRGKKWNYHFQNELGNMCKKDKKVIIIIGRNIKIIMKTEEKAWSVKYLLL